MYQYPIKVGDKIVYAHTSEHSKVTRYIRGEVAYIDFNEAPNEEGIFLVFNKEQFNLYKTEEEYKDEFYELSELSLNKGYIDKEEIKRIKAQYNKNVKFTWGCIKDIEVDETLSSILSDLEREVL